jgi:hypothetical protein
MFRKKVLRLFPDWKKSGKMCRVNFQAGKSHGNVAATISGLEKVAATLPRSFSSWKIPEKICRAFFQPGNLPGTFSLNISSLEKSAATLP